MGAIRDFTQSPSMEALTISKIGLSLSWMWYLEQLLQTFDRDLRDDAVLVRIGRFTIWILTTNSNPVSSEFRSHLSFT
jgi:hypothetical protein